MKRLLIIILIIMLLCTGAGAAFWFFVLHKKNKTKDKQPIKKSIPIKKPLITYKLSFPNFIVNITKNNKWLGIAFISFDILFKTKDICLIFENKPFLIESILLQKMSIYLSAENVANPIPYSKVQKMILQSLQDTILSKVVSSINVKQFYVRLQLTQMNNL